MGVWGFRRKVKHIGLNGVNPSPASKIFKSVYFKQGIIYRALKNEYLLMFLPTSVKKG